jgi:hypothetical protein
MNKLRLGINLLLIIVACLICSSAAQAQATRTWVSGVGDDANPCSRTAPCKTYAGAISKTAAGGEISTLDPGGFGAVTITKSITINGDGTLAGILAAGTNGVIINAGVNDVVVLRNISINGAGTGLNGIRFLAGKELIVENCSISGFTAKGIDISVSANARFDIINTTIDKVADGVSTINSGGILQGTLNNVRIHSTTNAGVNVLGGSLSITNSVVSNNTSFGIIAQGGTLVNVANSMVSHNGTGVSTNNAAGIIRLSNNVFTNNTNAIVITAGTIASFQNNSITAGQGVGVPNQNLTQQ